MSQVQLDAIYKVKPENLEEFKRLAAESIRIVREKDTRTLTYDFFANADETVFVAREIYESVAGLMESIQNLGELLPKVFAFSEFKIILYGEPSDEMLKIVRENGFEFYAHKLGLTS